MFYCILHGQSKNKFLKHNLALQTKAKLIITRMLKQYTSRVMATLRAVAEDRKKRKLEEVTVYDIGNSTSYFGEKAEHFLNIRIHETESFDDIINNGTADKDKITYGGTDINQELKDLFLHGFDRDAIRIYRPQNHKSLPKHAQTFLYKLSTVVNNNYVLIEPEHVENYIHDLMDNVLREAKFEDGTELILMPCVLRLMIGGEDFAAHADKEGRRGTEIIWVLDEDKHKFDKRWKRGDIQLIANMIAAAQTNRLLLEQLYPAKILGIKFDADRLYFYSACITEEYLDELSELPANKKCDVELIVNKFPKDRELSLSFYDDRKEIFLYLSAFRKYALGLQPIYVD